MIIYEVNLSIHKDADEDYRAWLDRHIQEILTLDGILRATWTHRDLDHEDKADQRHYTVAYEMRDHETYEDYLRAHAPRLRDEGIARFGGRFTATRRLHTLISRYASEHP
jgi:quinol monooxygenase YgiN